MHNLIKEKAGHKIFYELSYIELASTQESENKFIYIKVIDYIQN